MKRMIRKFDFIGPIIARSLPRSRLHVSQGPSPTNRALMHFFFVNSYNGCFIKKRGTNPAGLYAGLFPQTPGSCTPYHINMESLSPSFLLRTGAFFVFRTEWGNTTDVCTE